MNFNPAMFPLDMRDGLNYADATILNDLALKVANKDAIFIEVGSWKGHSAAILGLVAKNNGGSVYCIDHWKGSPGVPTHDANVKVRDVFQIFLGNMRFFGVSDYINPIVKESVEGVKEFRDEIADLIFIDADHRYSSVKQDIELWYPKVKRGGVLCGHDCEGYYMDYSHDNKQHIDREAEQDVSSANCHGGVVKALHDCFGRDFKLWDKSFTIVNEDNVATIQYTSMWVKEKNV